MKPQEKADLAIDLATALVKVACSAGLGISAVVIAPLTDLVGRKAKDRVEQRRLLRLLDECVDTVAVRLINSLNMETEFKGLPDNEQEAAVLAVKDTFQAADFDVADIVRNDLDVQKIERMLAPAANYVLSNALLSEGATTLYAMLLKDSCAYVIEIMTALPGFSVIAATELLKRDTQIISDLRKAISRLPVPRDPDDFTVNYRRIVAYKFDRMELLGVNIKEGASRRYPLTVAYISLHVLAGAQRKARSVPGSESRVTTGLRIEEILKDQKRLLLIGEAGSGKTTLLRWLAVKSARRNFEPPLQGWNHLTPFLIPMRRYPDGRFPTLNEFVTSVSSTIGEDLPAQWTRNLLLSGDALVLIDGIDELPDDQSREAAQDWIEDLTNEFPKSTFVVTSRPAAVKGGLRVSDFRKAELQPMSMQDINVFISRWHDALRQELGESEDTDTIPADRRAIIAAIERDSHLRSLANNPLLCALLCALNRQREGDLPRQRSEIYRAALEMLLERRDKQRGLETLDSSSQTIVLQELAFWLLRQGMLNVSMVRAQEVVDRILSSLPGINITSSGILEHLLTRSGLIREPIPGQLDFVHRTFQDYLSGKAAAENDEIGLLIGNAHSDQWRDVVVMAAALCQPRQREELLRGLIAESERRSDETLKLLTVACLQNAPQLSADLRSDIEDIAREFLPPTSMDAVQSLVAAGDLVVNVLAGRERMSDEEVAASIRLASMIGTDEALNLIAAIAETHTGIEKELVRAWRLFDPEKYAKKVLVIAAIHSDLSINDLELLPYTAYLESISSLRLNVPDAVDMSGLGGRPPALTTLSVHRRPRTNLKGIERWSGLEDLEIFFENTISDLRPIELLVSLKTLRINVVRGISVKIDLSPVVRLRKLEEIYVKCDTRYELYVGLTMGSALKRLIVSEGAVISDDGRQTLQRSGVVVNGFESSSDLVS